MMLRQDENVLHRREAEQGRANSGFDLEIEQITRLSDKDTLQLRIPLIRRQKTQIHPPEPDRPTLVDDRIWHTVRDFNRGTKCLVPGDNHVECPLQRIGIEFYPKAHSLGLVINRYSVINLLKEPEPLLSGAERARGERVAPRDYLYCGLDSLVHGRLRRLVRKMILEASVFVRPRSALAGPKKSDRKSSIGWMANPRTELARLRCIYEFFILRPRTMF